MFAVFTGAPHVGKSTLLGKFSDFGRSVMPEIAEEVINEGIYKPWLGDAEQLAFQAEVATRQRHKEAMLNNGHSVVYLDRGLVDAIAYRMVYGRSLTDLHMGMTAAHYAVAFVFEPLEGWENNGVRYEDPEFSRAITPVIKRVYASFDVPVISVPTMSVEGRFRFVAEQMIRFLPGRHLMPMERSNDYFGRSSDRGLSVAA